MMSEVVKKRKKKEEKPMEVSFSLSILQANGCEENLDVYEHEMKTGIEETNAFEEKGLAEYGVNCGVKCGHGCLYCSSSGTLRLAKPFQLLDGRTIHDQGYAVVHPRIVERVAEDAKTIPFEKRGIVELGTTVDLWAPEARHYGFGRGCLEAILREPGWTVRILTKSEHVVDDFDLIEQYRDRVLLGLSITATPRCEAMINVIETAASTLTMRMEVMREAHRRGFRTYGMLCPLIQGIGATDREVDELFAFCREVGCEEVFAENLNSRGKAMEEVEAALRDNGYQHAANRVRDGRRKRGYSRHVVSLIQRVQRAARKYDYIDNLKFLLYEGKINEDARAELKRDDVGIRWLKELKEEKEKNKSLSKAAGVME